MSKKLSLLLGILIIASLVLAACGPTETPVVEEPVVEEPVVEEPVVEEPAFLACQVTDMGGIDDRSFNATAWLGFEMARDQLGAEVQYLESRSQTDYEANLNAFIAQGCNYIVGVGFALGDAVLAAATANPDILFGLVDVNWLEAPNLTGSGYQIDQATFLAGYLAAGMTTTGVVGTYGGIAYPSVTAFMDGFALGVAYYNEQNGTSVQVIGWDPATQTGTFTGDFENLENGYNTTIAMLDEGADIIMPVAGPVGGGTLTALRERGTGLMIGVDTDWSASYPEYADVILASAMKHMENWVLDTVGASMAGSFPAGNYLGTLENVGVELVIGSAFVDVIPAEITAALETIAAGIVDGSIPTLTVVAE